MLIAITGVSRGLGKELARGFVAAGHTVAGCARNAVALAELQNELGTPNRFDQVSVDDEDQVQQWAQGILESCGVPDILINCAALMNRSAPLWELDGEEFSYVVDVNIKGTFHTIKYFVPGIVARGSGVIVNFSSYWGKSTSSDVAAYCATKFAIEGLSRGLADDLPNGVASVALNPGVIHTEMLESCFGESAASYPKPNEWAKSAVPFILQLSTAYNGSSLTVPGF
jgi:NAD(P)-dependent dehydrogenase (short-subunit alcohol dehydrogenase family)